MLVRSSMCNLAGLCMKTSQSTNKNLPLNTEMDCLSVVPNAFNDIHLLC